MSTETTNMNIDNVLDFLVENNIREIELDLDERPLWARWTERHGTRTVLRKQTNGRWVSMPESEAENNKRVLCRVK